MMRRAALLLLVSVAMVRKTAAHGAVTIPPPREAVDGDTAPWNGDVPWPIPFDNPNWCAHPSAERAGKDRRNLTGSNGQACFWFSNGCGIGVPSCDGNSGQLVPCCTHKYMWNGTAGTQPPPFGQCNEHGCIIVNPAAKLPDPFHPTMRPKGATGGKPTLCSAGLRTVNTQTACGSNHDFWQFAPWRAPGSVPVLDSCGVAGGRLPGQGQGTAGADYVNTTHAKLADRGSKLKPAPSGTVWTAGTDVEVAWTQKAWHGGGYQYRICPANSTLDEECFQKRPLKFVGQGSLRWGGIGGEQIWFNATDTRTGTLPVGSTWRKCPIPRGPWGWIYNGPSFEPVCEETAECRALVSAQHSPGDANNPCKCSGDGIGDLATMEIVDKVHIPSDLEGEWVLGWRWDCEESTQVWQSCSDVTIKNASA